MVKVKNVGRQTSGNVYEGILRISQSINLVKKQNAIILKPMIEDVVVLLAGII